MFHVIQDLKWKDKSYDSSRWRETLSLSSMFQVIQDIKQQDEAHESSHTRGTHSYSYVENTETIFYF